MVTPPLFFYLPAYLPTVGATVVGGAMGATPGGEADHALSPTALAPKRGAPKDLTGGQDHSSPFVGGGAEPKSGGQAERRWGSRR